jgi:hypothetical protein
VLARFQQPSTSDHSRIPNARAYQRSQTPAADDGPREPTLGEFVGQALSFATIFRRQAGRPPYNLFLRCIHPKKTGVANERLFQSQDGKGESTNAHPISS